MVVVEVGQIVAEIGEVVAHAHAEILVDIAVQTDQPAAFGAAIFAASKSSQHRVKEFNIKDENSSLVPIKFWEEIFK